MVAEAQTGGGYILGSTAAPRDSRVRSICFATYLRPLSPTSSKPLSQLEPVSIFVSIMPSDDEFDAIADDFDGFDFDAIPDLATLPPSQILIDDVSDIPPRPLSATSSTDYSCDDGIDDSLLAEIDAIESRLNQGTSESTESWWIILGSVIRF